MACCNLGFLLFESYCVEYQMSNMLNAFLASCSSAEKFLTPCLAERDPGPGEWSQSLPHVWAPDCMTIHHATEDCKDFANFDLLWQYHQAAMAGDTAVLVTSHADTHLWHHWQVATTHSIASKSLSSSAYWIPLIQYFDSFCNDQEAWRQSNML